MILYRIQNSKYFLLNMEEISQGLTMNQCQVSLVIFMFETMRRVEWMLLEGTKWATCYPTMCFDCPESYKPTMCFKILN